MTTLKNRLMSIIFLSVMTLSSQAQSEFQFKPVKVPKTDAEKRAILASQAVTIAGNSHPIAFHTILRSGTQTETGVFGQLLDVKGNPLKTSEGTPQISNKNDFSSLIPVGKKLFMVSHFESIPGALYLTELKQDLTNGQLTAIKTKPLDLSEINGIRLPCAGSVTGWNSHLGSEEYEPDARVHNPITSQLISLGHLDMAQYYAGNPSAFNPYNYGFAVEVQIHNEQGDYSAIKHYAMGRMSLELAYVMPDKKTVYLSEDGSNVGLYLFIADRETDLSAGTLYAMKWNQISAEQGGKAHLEWLSLGHATNQQVKSYLTRKITFNDIFETQTPTDKGTCPKEYQSINTMAGFECLKVKPDMEIAASRLETRRYAAIKGATTELRKQEGMTFDPTTNTLYIAISEIARGMENFNDYGQPIDLYDKGGPNDITLPFNLCGGIYALDLVNNDDINSRYVAKNMYGVIQGQMTQAYDKKSDLPPYDPNGPFAHNKCDLEGIANPDNISFIPGYHTLLIGEDTGEGHQNDMVWAYNLKAKQMTRIQTTPYGSESTSIYFYPNLNGFGYLMSVVQHPYGSSDQDKLNQPAEAFAYTGYLGPFPALK